MKLLLGRTALITGASRGIGRATAIRLAKSGAQVAINYVSNETEARRTAEEIAGFGGTSIIVKGDVSEEEDVQEMMELLGDAWGKLDILVSNAASGGFRSIRNATCRNFDAAFHTNTRALMLLVQCALPWFSKASAVKKVVAISSHGSHRALQDYALIGASKAALESLIRHMAYEFGPDGINFNCVLAGLVETDSTRLLPEAEKAYRATAERMLTSRKQLTADDVADVVHFLVSPQSDLIQGQTVVIDGGASLHL